jgi:hypothetical protein
MTSRRGGRTRAGAARPPPEEPDLPEGLEDDGILIDDPPTPEPGPSGPAGSLSGHRSPSREPSEGLEGVDDDTRRRLIDARQWLNQQAARDELDQLEALQARHRAGDKIDFTTVNLIARQPGANVPSFDSLRPKRAIRLPEPEKPTQFAASGRWEYDEWVRMCEVYHRRAAEQFPTEEDKVHFGQQYLASNVRRDWIGYISDKERKDDAWSPTWAEMKEYMLAQLGSEPERKQEAFNKLRRAKQDDRAPLALLNYLRPLWAEADIDDVKTQIRWFISCLSDAVQAKVLYDFKEEAKTLREAEDRATRAHRQLKDAKPTSQKPGKSGKRATSPAEGQAGPGAPLPTQSAKGKGRHKRHKSSGNELDKDQKSSKQEDTDKATKKGPRCFICGSSDHLRKNCPEKKQTSSDKPSSGKEAATKT